MTLEGGRPRSMNISRAEQINGWMHHKELTWLAEIAQKCRIIIEIGCYRGRSTRALADNSEAVIFAIDPWDGPVFKENGDLAFSVDEDIFREFKANLAGTNVIPIRQEFDEHIKLPKADFIFIDGDHRYFNVKRDIKAALKLLKPDGIIAGHDYGYDEWPGVKLAVDEFFPSVN